MKHLVAAFPCLPSIFTSMAIKIEHRVGGQNHELFF